MCKRLTQIFLTFFQDAGQVNPGTSFYKQFEWKRNCESELDKFFSYQTSDITCADLMLMRENYCSRSFGLAQHIEVRRLIWTSVWHLTFKWTEKPWDPQGLRSSGGPPPPPPPFQVERREPTANLMIKSPENLSLINRQHLTTTLKRSQVSFLRSEDQSQF